MQIKEEMKEKLILGIQALLGIIILALSVKNSAQVQSAQMKKVLEQSAKSAGKLQRKKHRLEEKLVKQKYKKAIQKVKGR